MTKREAAIVACYTGFLIGDIGEVYKYFSALEGRNVYTHELPSMREKHLEKCRQDFVALEVTE